jgi:penicillin-binding protein 2
VGTSNRGSPREVSPLLGRRIAIAIGAVIVSFVLMGGRLWYLQIVQGEQMRGLSEHNRIRMRRVAAQRGVIYDRFGVVLAENRPSFDVVLVPEDAGEVDVVLSRLGRYLGNGDAHANIPPGQRKRAPYQGVVLGRDVAWSGVVAVETHQLELPGVTLEVTPRRLYPFGTLAAHLLGYVGEATANDLAKRSELRMGDLIGKAGIERPLDEALRGVPGREQIEVDAVGRRVRVIDDEADVPGQNVMLTIDHAVQAAAEEALGENRGAIVALDPNTGEVLALASRPTFDPNVFAAGITAQAWRALVDDPYRPLTNRATQGQYPPGSTFKIIVGTAALEEKAISRHEPVCCKGGMPFGGRVFRCWKSTGHSCLSFHQALVQSCDVFFYEAGNRLGVDRIAAYARQYGLGASTGLGVGSEEPGLIPDSAWKQRRFNERWYPGETLSVAIGQGAVLTTPLQMAVAAATIANGGTRYRPFVIKRVDGPDDSVTTYEPEVVGRLEASGATLQAVRAALVDVVMGERGTGSRAKIDGFTVAGKTGTAQAAGAVIAQGGALNAPDRFKDHAWFVSYAPAEAPTIAVAVLVENVGQHGGTVAAPMARTVIEQHLARRPDYDEIRQAAHRPL